VHTEAGHWTRPGGPGGTTGARSAGRRGHRAAGCDALVAENPPPSSRGPERARGRATGARARARLLTHGGGAATLARSRPPLPEGPKGDS
jgi:hypothetical protein